MRRLTEGFRLLFEVHYPKVIGGCGLVGANVGIYSSLTDKYRKPNDSDFKDYLTGAIVGTTGGMIFGVFAPLLFPCVIGGAPAYVAFKIHSFRQESQQKAEKLEAPINHECQKKEEKHESQLR